MRRGGKNALLLGLDFDGTLAPYARRPDLVRLPNLNRAWLEILSGRRSVEVAIVSGRAIGDLKALVNVPGIIYAGNHGLEIEGPQGRWTHPRAAELEHMVRAVSKGIRAALGKVPGLVLQDKGLTLSLHYRRLPKNIPADTLFAVMAHLVKPFARHLHITHGQKVWEVRPRISWNKGHALLRILRRRKKWTAAFVGDDLTDEEGFRTLVGREVVTVRVGQTSDSAALFRLPHQKNVGDFLELISRQWPR